MAASGSVRIVRVKLAADAGERYEKLLGCRTTNGRRFTLLYEAEVPDALYMSTEFTIVGGRYIGVRSRFNGVNIDGTSAMVWDSRKRRLLHSSDNTCEPDAGPVMSVGVHEAVFLPRGALAYRCESGLYLADANGLRQLEPREANARYLGVSAARYHTRLYWIVDTPYGEQHRSLVLPAGR